MRDGGGTQVAQVIEEDRESVLRRRLSEIKDRDADIRDQAARSLGDLGDPRGATSLAAALNDVSHEVRWSAAGALDELRDPRAREFYVRALRHGSAADRWAAVWALGKALQRGDRRVLPSLRSALADSDPEVRNAAHTLIGTEPF